MAKSERKEAKLGVKGNFFFKKCGQNMHGQTFASMAPGIWLQMRLCSEFARQYIFAEL